MGNHRKEQLNQLLQGNPEDPFLHHALGLELVKSGDEVAAQTHFEKALQIDPNHAGTYYHLAKLYERQAEYERAMETYRLGMRVTNQLQEAHFHNELRTAFQLLQDEMEE